MTQPVELLRTADLPALGDVLPNGRTLTALHHIWYAGDGELPYTVLVAVARGEVHEYAVWDLVRREDGTFETVIGSYFEWAVDAFAEYKRRIDRLAKSRAGCEVEIR